MSAFRRFSPRRAVAGLLLLGALAGAGLCASVLAGGSRPCGGAGVHAAAHPSVRTAVPPILGVEPDQLRPIDHFGAATAPPLVVSGAADDRTPISEAGALFDHAREPKQFWAVQGAAHVDLERYGPAAYWRVVLPFLTRHLQCGHTGDLGAGGQ